jgi:hypothetical protein
VWKSGNVAVAHYTDSNTFLNRRATLTVSVLYPEVVVVSVTAVLVVGQERTGKPVGVHPATVMVVYPDEMVLVMVKVAVRVVVSWTVRPKQERS